MEQILCCKKYYLYICEELLDLGKKNRRVYDLFKNYLDDIKEREYEDFKKLLGNGILIPNKLYEKNLDNERCKLLIQELRIDDTIVFCMRKILMQEEREYSQLKSDSNNWLKINDITPEESKNIKSFIEGYKNKINNNNMSESIKKWLNNGYLDLDVSIYESDVWVSNLNENIRHHWAKYKELLIGIVQAENNIEYSIVNEDYCIYLASKNSCHILYKIFNKNYKLYFLFNHFYGNPPNDEDIKKILNLYSNYASDNILEILPYARRAYPEWALADDEIWCKIENITSDDNNQGFDLANLALSGEEEQILKNSELPLFINGQAGSGKSTILFYLFAGYCSKNLKNGNNLQGTPLFLTYNNYLLMEAKRAIKSILIKNPNYESDKRFRNENDLDSYLNNVMYTFQDLIKKRILTDDCILTKKFSEENYIDYNRFTRLYNNKVYDERDSSNVCRLRERDRYSSDLVWHTIRTYIKGYKAESDLTPQEYIFIPKKDKSISPEKYREIFNTIYSRWYKVLVEEKLLWDDQDLVKCALKYLNNNNSELYPIIVCDEAQDFTRAELDLILNLSEFYRRNGNIALIAFAGDPLQTLNPTGFSWKRIRANFYEKFNTEIKLRRELKLHDLNKNYRSVPEIVKLANLVQFYRYKLLSNDIEELKPQDWWQYDKAIKPCKFIIDENITIEDLYIAEDTIIIIPTEKDNEKIFIENDPVLKLIIKENSGNVFSPANIKGLEFNKVIIYKFGEVSENIIRTLLENNEVDENIYIKASYFFNKLYVAITRAKEYLFIVDTKSGEDYLWKYFTEGSELDIYSKAVSNEKKIWKEDKIGYISWGKEEQKIELIENNPLSIAEELAIKGRKNNNPDYLHRASYYYRKNNQENKSKICKAEAYELEKDWEEAANIWLELGEYDRAQNCYLNGACWERILRLQDIEQNRFSSTIIKLSKLMVSESSINLLIDLFQEMDIHKIIKGICNNVQETILEKIITILRIGLNDDTTNWQKIIELIEPIKNYYFSEELNDILAHYNFNVGNYRISSKLWETINFTSPYFYWSKAFSTSNKIERINWLVKINYNTKIGDILVQDAILDTFNTIKDNVEPNIIDSIAFFFYKGADWVSALKFWEMIDRKNHQQYYWAKYNNSTTHIEKIKWLSNYINVNESESNSYTDSLENELNKMLISEWDSIKNEKESLNSLIKLREKYVLYKLLQKLERYDEAFLLVNKCYFIEDWIEFNGLIKSNRINEKELLSLIKGIANHRSTKEELKNYDEQLELNDDRRRAFESLKSTIEKNILILNKFEKLLSNNYEILSYIAISVEKLIDDEEIIKWKRLKTLYNVIIERKNTPLEIHKWAQRRWLNATKKYIDSLIKEKNNYEQKGEFRKSDNTDKIIHDQEKEYSDKKSLWGIDNNLITDFEALPSTFDFKDLLTKLYNYIVNTYPEEVLLSKILNRLISQEDKDLILTDWENIKSILTRFDDNIVKEYKENINNAIVEDEITY